MEVHRLENRPPIKCMSAPAASYDFCAALRRLTYGVAQIGQRVSTSNITAFATRCLRSPLASDESFATILSAGQPDGYGDYSQERGLMVESERTIVGVQYLKEVHHTAGPSRSRECKTAKTGDTTTLQCSPNAVDGYCPLTGAPRISWLACSFNPLAARGTVGARRFLPKFLHYQVSLTAKYSWCNIHIPLFKHDEQRNKSSLRCRTKDGLVKAFSWLMRVTQLWERD
ncbi:hypothetical protein C8R45DRAFT_926352 [Mycena sanguinolenta]|nr:hypothetical protein C8R45DRAFT_926352 [Mycena sanguinolenta]